MMTPQEIQDKRFEKAMFGGYDTGGVDGFLETIFEDYGALFKENAILKNKLKVLVDKIEEYRSVDDVMRKMMLTAQQKAAEIVETAQKQAEEMLSAAQKAAISRSQELTVEVGQEEARLQAIKSETGRFVIQMRDLYKKEVELLASALTIPVNESPKAVRMEKAQATANDIEDSVAANIAREAATIASEMRQGEQIPKTPAEPVYQPPIQRQEPSPQQPAQYQQPFQESGQPLGRQTTLPTEAKVYEVKFGDDQGADFSDIWKPEEDTVVPRPRTDFENLEFGPNYGQDNSRKGKN